MQQAGYRTALIGKYLNGYYTRTSKYTPPGWDRWFAVPTSAYYNYWAATKLAWSSVHGNRHFGATSADYITRVLAAKATHFIQNSGTKPFFLYYATTAPHEPAIPDPRDVGRFTVSGYVQPPSFGKAEAGAPNYIKALAWDTVSVKEANSLHKRQLNSNYSVDRSIGQIWNALPDNTVVLFMSDNGSRGEHRWDDKSVPYNSSLRIPSCSWGRISRPPFQPAPIPVPRCTASSPRAAMGASSLTSMLPHPRRDRRCRPGHAFEGRTCSRRQAGLRRAEHWFQSLPTSRYPPTYCGSGPPTGCT
jgi:arylsulfatase A-like enzyme